MSSCHYFLPTDIQDKIVKMVFKKRENSAILIKRQRKNSEILNKYYNEVIFPCLNFFFFFLISRNISASKVSKRIHVPWKSDARCSIYIYKQFQCYSFKCNYKTLYLCEDFPLILFSQRKCLVGKFNQGKEAIYVDLLGQSQSTGASWRFTIYKAKFLGRHLLNTFE